MFEIRKTVSLDSKSNRRPDDWIIPHRRHYPEDAYQYVQNGHESEESIDFMIVIEDGADE